MRKCYQSIRDLDRRKGRGKVEMRGLGKVGDGVSGGVLLIADIVE